MHKVIAARPDADGRDLQNHGRATSSSRDNPDFHPTDVLEDADGRLLVVDTGGWYKLCCPTSQLDKPDVLGGIYRVRRTWRPQWGDRRGDSIDWKKAETAILLAHLADARPFARRRVMAELASRGIRDRADFERGLSSFSAELRRNLVTALTRIDSPEARGLAREALMDREESVRWAAIHSVSVRRDVAAAHELVILLNSGNSEIRRAAAEAIGRLGLANSSMFLLSAVAPPKGGTSLDRSLEHALIYALIETGDATATARGLQAEDAATRRVALIALDQMPGGDLKSDQVIPLLASTNALLKETALWIIGHHPEWGGEMARWIQDWFKPISSTAEQSQFADILARSAGNPEVQARIAAMAKQFHRKPQP